MTGDKEHNVQFRCSEELKRRLGAGAGLRNCSNSEYIRQLIREDTEDLPEHLLETDLSEA